MAPPKKTAQPAAPAPPSDYEQGMLDCLAFLSEAAGVYGDAEREVRRITHDATPELRALLAFANPAANIASNVRSAVEMRAIRHLTTRRTGNSDASRPEGSR